MKLEMHPNSLFAVLLRSPWWVSIGIAVALFALARMLLARFEQPDLYGFMVALPFAVIGCYAAWQRLRAPSAKKIAGRLEALRAMGWEEFAAAVEAAYRKEGYAVERVPGAQADFELAKGGRTALLACKRWKASRTGVEPLKALHAAAKSRGANDCIYFSTGEVSDPARAFASRHDIRLLEGAELAAKLSG
jgi:restriction system protein